MFITWKDVYKFIVAYQSHRQRFRFFGSSILSDRRPEKELRTKLTRKLLYT